MPRYSRLMVSCCQNKSKQINQNVGAPSRWRELLFVSLPVKASLLVSHFLTERPKFLALFLEQLLIFLHRSKSRKCGAAAVNLRNVQETCYCLWCISKRSTTQITMSGNSELVEDPAWSWNMELIKRVLPLKNVTFETGWIGNQ
jgi:hypothetical protein